LFFVIDIVVLYGLVCFGGMSVVVAVREDVIVASFRKAEELQTTTTQVRRVI